MSGWQPIETAPKNLQKVLVLTKGGDMFVAQYECHADPPFWSWDILDVFPGGECEIIPPPTHWMPLPEPPDSRPSGLEVAEAIDEGERT